ncbi:zinc finger, CCHC-type containing protein [Tanacetum coccineum]
MGDENSIRTLGDYSKPSHEGYRNTIDLPKENNVVPLRSDTIRLVQNGCSFHGLRPEDPNQHLKDFLKLVESLDLNGDNSERMRLCLFQFSLRDQVSNWLERLPAGSITTWEDLTTHFFAQFFPPGRIEKLRNNILMFQQHQGESLSKAWTQEEEKDVGNNRAIIKSIVEPSKSEEEEPPKKAFVTNGVERRADDEPTKSVRENFMKNEEEEVAGVSSSHTAGYYLKHRIKEKLIEGLVDNQKFNDSLSVARVGKIKRKTYNLLPRGHVNDLILKKRVTRKEDIGGNFEIPCNIGGLKHTNALVDQGSDVNVMPFSTYSKLTNERPVETDIRLFLASHSYIYPLGIAEDVLVDVAGYVYPVDFMILDIKEDERRPFILGTSFLTTAKAVIKFDKGTITLKFRKNKISFYRIPKPHRMIEKGIKNDIEPIAPMMTINRLVLEWEEKIKLHQEKEMKFDR